MSAQPNPLVRMIASAPLPDRLRRPLRAVYRSRTKNERRTEWPGGPDVRRAIATGDRPRIDEALRDFVAYRADVEAAVSPGVRGNPELPITLTTGPQSTQFMIDLLPHIQRHLAMSPRGRRFDVLDVGPGNGHGTALLASLYASARLGYELRVTATDIVDHYHDYITVHAPFVNHVLEDVYDMTNAFDIVIASHVIEHLADPVAFCEQLRTLARECVFIVAPYNEPSDRLTRGHRTVVDAALVERMNPVEVTVMNSVAWGAFMDPPYEMVIAKLAGSHS